MSSENSKKGNAKAGSRPGKEGSPLSKDKGNEVSSTEIKEEVQKPAVAQPAAKQEHTHDGQSESLVRFLKEVATEFRRVSWPDRQQVLKETLSVLVLVSIITGGVLVFDFAVARAVFEPLDKLARHMGGGIGVVHESNR